MQECQLQPGRGQLIKVAFSEPKKNTSSAAVGAPVEVYSPAKFLCLGSNWLHETVLVNCSSPEVVKLSPISGVYSTTQIIGNTTRCFGSSRKGIIGVPEKYSTVTMIPCSHKGSVSFRRYGKNQMQSNNGLCLSISRTTLRGRIYFRLIYQKCDVTGSALEQQQFVFERLYKPIVWRGDSACLTKAANSNLVVFGSCIPSELRLLFRYDNRDQTLRTENGLCLGATGLTKGAEIHLLPCRPVSRRHWRFHSNLQLELAPAKKNSGLCIERVDVFAKLSKCSGNPKVAGQWLSLANI